MAKAYDDNAYVADRPVGIYAMPGHVIRRLHQASQAIFDTAMAEAGLDLTSVQFAALSVIEARPGLDQATLASAIAFDRATTGGVIDRLEAKGLVRREVDPSDRRSRRLTIEAAGRRVLAEVLPVVAVVQERMLQGLSAAERKTFMQLMSKALEAVGDVSRPSAAGRPETSAATFARGPRRRS